MISFVVLCLLAGLPACQPIPQPFAHDPGSSGHVIEPRTAFGGIAVLPVTGVPEENSLALTTALAEALGRHEIPAAPGSGNRRSRLVQGTATTRPVDRNLVEVAIAWDLFERDGEILGTRRVSRILPVADWQGARGTAMRSLTAEVADGFAALVHGPSDTASGTFSIPLHVWPVDGVPAGDNAQLRHAMESALRRRDFAVTPGLDGARLVVAGALTLGPADADRRPIEITWSVLDTAGQELGKLTQRNAVPAAALETGWQTLAGVIAENAAGGVSDLVRRLPPEALSRAPKGAKPGK